ncbi:site-specific recombinase XerD [Pseudomonas sp. 3296]|uniref:tyrosine-type recombinase/integrase n=1 Tax=Pseudomonas sp. 3296 TaxID=2817753 RepID=UPI00285A8D7E|nr:tyrosine-type recombinase/integrase [Pseudomonas sp. 3296]MDR6914447.1 site-specific recombinase XerD [Pseudomonas sp. 3296]
MKKLYRLTVPGDTLPFAVAPDHSVTMTEASLIPTLSWPNGSWCIEANFWMLKLYEQGRSRSQRGGTLLSYATNISHLLRYIYAQKTSLLNITDSQFCFFITTLLGERADNGTKKREQNHVVNIGRNCLQLISYASEIFATPPRLSIGEKKIVITAPNGNRIKRIVQSHPALALTSRISRRFPINAENIKKLRVAAHRDKDSSSFIKARRRVMIRAFEMTGGRRMELSLLTIDAINRAELTGYLPVRTVKRGQSQSQISGARSEQPKITREIPISVLDLKLLKDFITDHRAPLVGKFLSKEHDHGYLFVSERTGSPLQPNHMTAELSTLKRLSGIEEPISPHLFRHRFITKIFVAELLKTEISTLKDFKAAMLCNESLKRKVCELTGHKNLSSLDVYIHLAWDEVDDLRMSLPNIVKLQSIDAIREQLNELLAKLNEDKMTPEHSTLLNLLASFEALL